MATGGLGRGNRISRVKNKKSCGSRGGAECAEKSFCRGRSLCLGEWVNLALGIHHYATGLARYPEVIRGLAAYNAGTTRVDRWSTSPLNGQLRPAAHARDPLDDVDIFVERIPFVETRDYVRAIVRNQAVYRMIYGDKR